MKGFVLFLGVIPIFWGLNCCNRFNPEPDPPSSEKKVVVDAELYKKGVSDIFSILDARIVGDSIEIRLSASGCSGDTWEVKLVDSGAIAESFPVQRYLRLLLRNEELCDALISKKVTFDLRSIRTDDGKIILHLMNWEKPLLYVY